MTTPSSPAGGAPLEPRVSADDARMLAALQAGDEAAFEELIGRYHTGMVRLALNYVPSAAVAEEVAQEAWIGVLKGVGRFEGRSSLRTWIYRILVNTAVTRGRREGRSVPFSALFDAEGAPPEVAMDPAYFGSSSHHWATKPESWEGAPEAQLLAGETRARIDQAIAALPPAQREVITLRDVQGFASDEVCNILGVSESNQRVLLHRARSKVRRALSAYLGMEPAPA
ncbi:MAG TPA: sigma-70 family RNA polymerase sigma factor [Dehalococcoidia bacterium]|nr:sigma-70 family RNA polymerase sigma factor [Dehalococcoidia bacterium]